ncbi:hypothetical protein O3P69_019818, partial [Scylla paramamosain]
MVTTATTTTPPPPPLSLPPPPPRIIYGRVVQGEITHLLITMKKGSKWTSTQTGEATDPLSAQLQGLYNQIASLDPLGSPLEPLEFLEPFLAVIRSEDTTGPVTRDALGAVNRMLGYGLLDPPPVAPLHHHHHHHQHHHQHRLASVSAAAEGISSAVTRARFIGTESAADEAVLFGILWVLRALVLSRAGVLLSNDSICEILNSAF